MEPRSDTLRTQTNNLVFRDIFHTLFPLSPPTHHFSYAKRPDGLERWLDKGNQISYPFCFYTEVVTCFEVTVSLCPLDHVEMESLAGRALAAKLIKSERCDVRKGVNAGRLARTCRTCRFSVWQQRQNALLVLLRHRESTTEAFWNRQARST